MSRPRATIAALGSDGRRWETAADAGAGNDALAIAEELGLRHLAFLGADGEADAAAPRFEHDSSLALEVLAEPAAPPMLDYRPPTIRALALRFLAAPADGPIIQCPIVVSVEAALDVGGFDPAFPGFGWVDLATRLDRAGWSIGVEPASLPFVDALHPPCTTGGPGAELIARFRAEARWAARYGSLGAFRARVVAASRLAPVVGRRLGRAVIADGGRDTARMVQAEARRGWPQATPTEAQLGVGRRADWRFLLPAGPRSHTLIVDRRADEPPSAWDWLVDDGWTERLSDRPDAGDPADVVVIGVGQSVGGTVVGAGPSATVCVLRSPSPLARPGHGFGRAVVQELASHGFVEAHRYLAVPHLEAPKRFVPLDHPGGLDWLLDATPPPAAGRLSIGHRLRRRVAGLVPSATVRAAGDLVIVARRSATPDGFTIAGLTNEQLPPATTGAVLLTSGFDEGSRIVVLPLSDRADRRPRTVLKVSARPAYNHNIDREHATIGSLGPRAADLGLVPELGRVFDVGPLRAGTERYVGRWTVADVLHEQPDRAARTRALGLVADAALELAGATKQGELRWSRWAFDDQVGRWLDRLDAATGPTATMRAFRAALLERSDQLAGQPVPLAARHFDFGPWNIVFRPEANGSPLTIVDWETSPPRLGSGPGLAGADQLYFVKYWLHVALGAKSLDDELQAFAHLADESRSNDPRQAAADSIRATVEALGIDPAFVPILAAHVWAEAACYTMARRAGHGGDPGSPGRYLRALAADRRRLLRFWSG